MKTNTKLLLAGGATLAVGAYAYRMGVNHVQFSLDGYQPAPDGAGLLMRIKATNPNKFFGYPVPQALINVFDNNSNFLGTAINNQLQYIPANSTSFIYAVVQPNYQNLVSVIMGIISSGTLPTNLIFNGLVKVGPVQIPFDTGAKIGSTRPTSERDFIKVLKIFEKDIIVHVKKWGYVGSVVIKLPFTDLDIVCFGGDSLTQRIKGLPKNKNAFYFNVEKFTRNRGLESEIWQSDVFYLNKPAATFELNIKNAIRQIYPEMMQAIDALEYEGIAGFKENFLLATSLTPWPIL